MNRLRRTEIVLETCEVIVTKSHDVLKDEWCHLCLAFVKMAPPETAAALAGRDVRTLYRLVESSDLHFAETTGGKITICMNSLMEISERVTAGVPMGEGSV